MLNKNLSYHTPADDKPVKQVKAKIDAATAQTMLK